ncbi:DNA polymerase [Plasticicumulans lactativorans]|uniref:Type-4 uracil-DNA glycosylase n=1 Tax=Plasticicumulans lactativorans TaxID=1133106 RepID=A0A4R2L9G8_9GAMM|nr:uracil-DNA glycosylase [Plasticicumulans lactativorans]TCO80899.1 DNA polymerase [Plasticicumulans lactativorans]
MSEHHRRYLAALGIPLWLQRDPPALVATDAVVPAPPAGILPAADAPAQAPAPVPAPQVVDEPMTAAPVDVPAATEIPDDWALWAELAPDEAPAPEVEPAASAAAPPPRAARIAALDWDGLAAAVRGCEACELCRTRTQTVFGVGNRRARWMVIGEAPGADEDRQGEPFVGQAGQLLNAMLRAIGLAREEVFIANVLKCRPPNNRDPSPAEAAACRPFLERQIELVAPELILAVGRISAQHLLATDVPVGRLRGRVHRYGARGIPLVVTYHPAYLLRAPLEKRKAWDDLELACAQLRPVEGRA